MTPGFIEGVADALEYGTIKYKAWNWMEGWMFHRPYASILRHLFAWFKREEYDPETKANLEEWANNGNEVAQGLLARNPKGLRHLDMAACQLMFLSHINTRYSKLDDRPDLR